MLLNALDQIQSSPVSGLTTLAVFCFALVVAITFHEFSHALSATLLGDPTARSQRRLSLNPLAHLDPLGTAMLLIGGFGWGRPVPVNPARLRSGERAGAAIVSLAGPLSNVLVAIVAAIPINAGLVTSDFFGFYAFTGHANDMAAYVIGSVVFWNLLLATFNLIPIAPLDGFKVALGVLPEEAASRFARLERRGPAILLAIIMLGFLVPGLGILPKVIRPMVEALGGLVLGGHF